MAKVNRMYWAVAGSMNLLLAVAALTANASALPLDTSLIQATGGRMEVSDSREQNEAGEFPVELSTQGFEDRELFEEMIQNVSTDNQDAKLIFVNADGQQAAPVRKNLMMVVDKTKQTLVLTEDGQAVFPKVRVSTGGGVHVPKNGEQPTCGFTPSRTFRFALTEDRFYPQYFSKKYEAWVKWAVYIADGFFLHQAPTAAAEKIIGRPASGGCIRLRAFDAKNLYEYLSKNKGSTLTIQIVGDDRKELDACRSSQAFKSAMRAYDQGQSNGAASKVAAPKPGKTAKSSQTPVGN